MAEDKSPAKKPAAAKSTAAKKPAASKAAADKKPAAAKKPAADKPAAAKSTAAKKPAASKAAAEKKPAAAKKPAADKPAAASKSSTAAKPAAAKKPAVDQPKVPTLRMHHLRPAPGAHTKKTRVGRGEGSKGKTAGRGTKGTGARYQVPARFEGGQTPIHMRIPKLRGFKSPFKEVYQVVNLGQINTLFPKGGAITKADLVDKGAVRKNRPVKVLGDGDLNVKITLTDVEKVSQAAKSKIEAAGGSVKQG